MRKVLILLITTVQLAFGQRPDNYALLLGGDRSDFAKDIINTSDGGFLVAGSTSSFGFENAQAYFIKLDSNIMVEWSAVYGTEDHEHLNAVVETDDGGYAAVGYTNNVFEGDYDIFLIKIDSDGEYIYSWSHGGQDWDFGKDLVEASPGKLFIAAETYSFGSGMNDGYLLAYDENTDPKPIATATFGNDSIDYFTSLDVIFDGSLMLTGATSQGDSGMLDGFIARYTDLLDLVDVKYYGKSADDAFNDIRYNPDYFRVVCTGFQVRPSDNFKQTRSIIYSVLGDSLFFEGDLIYDNWDGEGRSTANDGSEFPIILASVSGFGPGGTDFKWQFAGGFVGEQLSSKEDDEPYGIVKVPNDTFFIIVGHTTGFGAHYEDILLYHTNGKTPGDNVFIETVETPPTNSTPPEIVGILDKNHQLIEFSVYPNPVSGMLHLNHNLELQTLHVFDTKGQLIEQLQANEKTFNVEHLKPGMYILQGFSRNGESFESKFLLTR